ncbi:MAG: DUF3604 domain-containing protein [Oscillospiraceae bacterium]
MILWGDLHNHCGITYGFGSLENALKIARSHLDFCSITGHAMWPDMYPRTEETKFIVDFHNSGFEKLRNNWESIRAEIARQNSNELVTFQGYEMHSSKYGDHHFISPDDDFPLIYRNSPAELVKDCKVRAIAIPHHIGYTPGYRGINWDLFEQSISPCVEVVSKHGCAMSENSPYPYYHDMGPRDSRNTVYEGLRRNNKFSFLGSTDHHAGFPGSYQDGLTAVLAKEKTREAIWQALLTGKTYAVTGDRILCDFTINNHGLGETVHSDKRVISCKIRGEYWADKLVVYKNLKPIYAMCGEMAEPYLCKKYKLRIEMGWGNKEELTAWDGTVVTNGKILSANTYWRGRSLLSPTNHDGKDTVVNEIDNHIAKESDTEFAWHCETVRNKSTLHAQTDAVVLEIQGEMNTEITVNVNGRSYKATIEELLQHGISWHQKQYHSEAVKIHSLIPEYNYIMNLEFEDNSLSGTDVYHMEFSQKNGQWAFVSPIYATGE